MLEGGTAIEPETGNSHHGQLDRQHIPPFFPEESSPGAICTALTNESGKVFA